MKKLDMQKIKEEMIDFLQTETKDRGFEKVIFGLSGGLDSVVVAYLCKEAFGKNAKAVLMPSSVSNQENLEDAIRIAQTLQIPYEIIPIKDYEKIFSSYEGINQERIGNFCARVRMMILYDLSYKEKSLVIGTSNKSERMLGYGTIYGDLACAINPIGDLFKTQLFAFADFLGIEEKIIQKKPSADLYVGQCDEDELGYSYEEIDEFLHKITQKELDLDNTNLIFAMMRNEYCETFLKDILERIRKNRFKTQQPRIFILETKKERKV